MRFRPSATNSTPRHRLQRSIRKRGEEEEEHDEGAGEKVD
jgi:hypothetical protein